MPFISAVKFLSQPEAYQAIDIRSTALFEAGHLPGAVPLPMQFKDNALQAICGAWELKKHVDPNLLIGDFDSIAQRLEAISAEATPLLYFTKWSIPSKILQLIFKERGKSYALLEGGYPAYSSYLSQFFAQIFPFYLLTGKTGCGKTICLRALSELGAQVIDLEALAEHQGSVFGQLTSSSQISSSEFHFRLWQTLNQLDSSQPIFIEQKGNFIGHCSMPDGLLKQLATAPRIQLQSSFAQRVRRLRASYAHLQDADLRLGVQKLRSKLDPDLLVTCILALEQRDYDEFASVLLGYYDESKQYQWYGEGASLELAVDGVDWVVLAGRILALVTERELRG